MSRPRDPRRDARVRFQAPMHVGSQDQWFILIRRRLKLEAEKLARASEKRRKRDRLTEEECFEFLCSACPDEEQLLREAISFHIHLFAEAARAQAGFDLQIEPQQLEIGGSRNWVFAFATMSAAGSRKLLQIPGVRERLVMLCLNRGRLKKEYVGRRIEECHEEVLMDLLCAALPAATEDLVPSPALIVDRFFESPHFNFVLDKNVSHNREEKRRRELQEQALSTTPSRTMH
jgi:hypothetical protein